MTVRRARKEGGRHRWGFVRIFRSPGLRQTQDGVTCNICTASGGGTVRRAERHQTQQHTEMQLKAHGRTEGAWEIMVNEVRTLRVCFGNQMAEKHTHCCVLCFREVVKSRRRPNVERGHPRPGPLKDAVTQVQQVSLRN
ncbi:hypothetical protein PAL_GLEAN10013899 [Pteropus alecto]|uniref:Uncharacterized protein n=1 Tax=Pteropus alecto TaxID=9402 RepID=L5K8A6_PTEAL|nr:hypothetical protein PAL_GLEAN10013899 [Pteropus alecto]